MKKKLTAPFVSGLKPSKKAFEVYDTDLIGLTLRVQSTGKKTYYLRYRLESGQRRRIRLGSDDALKPPTARALAKKVLTQVANGDDPALSRKRTKSGSDTLGGYIETVYSPWVKSHQKSGALTVSMIQGGFKDLLGKPLTQLNPFLFEKWRKNRLDAGSKPVTVNRYLAALRGALTKAVAWRILDANPLNGVKALMVDQRTVDRYLTPDEESRLYEALDSREQKIRKERLSANQWRKERGYDVLPNLAKAHYADYLKPMVTISLNTGLRRGELFSLKWSEVDLRRRTLSVTSSSSKSGSVRHIPLNEEARKTLVAWKRQTGGSDLVFTNKKGQRFDHVNTAWRTLLSEARISDFRWHDMRHHFASSLVMNSVDLNTVRELLGHSDIKMTLRYAHLAPEHKMKAVETISRAR